MSSQVDYARPNPELSNRWKSLETKISPGGLQNLDNLTYLVQSVPEAKAVQAHFVAHHPDYALKEYLLSHGAQKVIDFCS